MEINIIIISNLFLPDTGGLYSTVEDWSDEIILFSCQYITMIF